MKNPFKERGCVEKYGQKNYMYEYKNLDVVVSCVPFVDDEAAAGKEDTEIIHISFSSRNGSEMRQREIDECLDHFGLDRTKEFITFDKKSPYPPHYVVKHYSQTRPRTPSSPVHVPGGLVS